MNNKRKRTLLGRLIAGIILAFGPVWGQIGTVIAMVNSFSEVSKSGASNPELLAENISAALYTTLAGYIALPIGIILIVVTVIKLSRETNDSSSDPCCNDFWRWGKDLSKQKRTRRHTEPSFTQDQRLSPTQRTQAMNPIPKHLCRIVSFLGLACALFCLWYIASAAASIFGSPPREDTPPRFVEWYAGLSSVAALIAVGAAAGSIDLARLRIRGVRMLTICSLLPLPLIMIVGMSWLSPMGMSIAAASGVSLGGLMPMIFSLLPLWASLLWIFAFRSHRPLQSTIS